MKGLGSLWLKPFWAGTISMEKSLHNTIFWVLVMLVICPTATDAEIQGSAHDFSMGGAAQWSGGAICQACHTPHDADKEVTKAPLWNHQLSEATYTVYSSDTMNSAPEQPKGISKLCLSCHDGTVALDNFGNTTDGDNFISGDTNIGIDLSDDHPVSVPWTHQSIVPWEFTEQCTYCHDNIGEDPAKYRLPFYSYYVGDSYYIECSSCHDPHNNGDLGADAQPYLLRMSNNGSALCLQCHNR